MTGGELSHSTIITNFETFETIIDEPDGKFGWSVALNNNGTLLAVGKPYYKELERTIGLTMNGNGVVIIFEYINNVWTLKQQVEPPLDDFFQEEIEINGRNFGFSVDLNNDGTQLIVGNPAIDKSNGTDTSLNTETDWNQKGSDIDGETMNDQSGYSVSLNYNGSIVAIGAPYNDGMNGANSGHVRVYQFLSDLMGPRPGGGNRNDWNQLGSDIDGEAADDESGTSVSLNSDGTIVAVGAPGNNGVNGINSGHVRVYQYNAGITTWVQLGSDIDGEALGDNSGVSVSLSGKGTIVAVGATFNDGNGADSGHVRVYKYNGLNAWAQLGPDIDGEALGDGSGISVSLSIDGAIVAVGATLNDGNGADSGHVRVYQYNGATWVQLGNDINGEAGGDESGISVSLSDDGTIVAVGATYNNGNGLDSGHVRVYKYNGVDTWNQLGSDIDGEAAGDRSGVSVSLSGNGTIVAVSLLKMMVMVQIVVMFVYISGMV